MPYLTSASEMFDLIADFSKAGTLWIDTEVADYQSKNPRLSLIQVLDDSRDLTGNRTFLLDVLEEPLVAVAFIEQVMLNPAVEKVFHNAKFDLKLLGGNKAVNVTCTMEIAKKIPYYILPLPDYQLKTLATELCNFHYIDKQEQGSDWSVRPLSYEQIEYAYLDCIYLAQVHSRLLEIFEQSYPDPESEDINLLSEKYSKLESEWKLLKSEYEHLQERLKKAMQVQSVDESSSWQLKTSDRTLLKVPFSLLARLVASQDINLDFPVTLTKTLQKELGESINELPVEVEKSTSLRLVSKNQSGEVDIDF